MHARRVVTGLAVLGVAAACGGGRRNVERLSLGGQTYVIVRNNNWADVTIFAARGMTRARIGFVNALSERTLLVPRSSMPDGTVRLLIDPIGSEKIHLTESIAVNPGQHIELTVMPSIPMTTLAVTATHRPR